MKKYRFEFDPMPTYEKIIKFPMIILLIAFIYAIIIKVGSVFAGILFGLFLLKSSHTLYTKAAKKICFSETHLTLVHFNGKITEFSLDDIAGIMARKYTSYQIHDSNVVHFKKHIVYKRAATFYIPSTIHMAFMDFLKEKNIKYRNIGFRI